LLPVLVARNHYIRQVALTKKGHLMVIQSLKERVFSVAGKMSIIQKTCQ